jgi:hypothetical protein
MKQDKFGVWRIKMVSSWFDLSEDRIESVGDNKPISIPIQLYMILLFHLYLFYKSHRSPSITCLPSTPVRVLVTYPTGMP